MTAATATVRRVTRGGSVVLHLIAAALSVEACRLSTASSPSPHAPVAVQCTPLETPPAGSEHALRVITAEQVGGSVRLLYTPGLTTGRAPQPGDRFALVDDEGSLGLGEVVRQEAPPETCTDAPCPQRYAVRWVDHATHRPSGRLDAIGPTTEPLPHLRRLAPPANSGEEFELITQCPIREEWTDALLFENQGDRSSNLELRTRLCPSRTEAVSEYRVRVDTTWLVVAREVTRLDDTWAAKVCPEPH
ncbi:MAG TPA: hypothetical protein VGI39_36810 [Polyangiaceae bacterium]|jgi:hypothetical protein